MKQEADNRLVSALARGISILRCFSPTSQELSAKELMDMTNLPKPTLFRLLDTLCELGLLRYSDRLSKYVPGLDLLNLAVPVLSRITLRQIARPLMQDLADHLQGQLHIVAGTGLNISYVEIAQGRQSHVFKPEVGMHLSLSRTASGRAYLSQIDPNIKQQYIKQFIEKNPDRSEWLTQRMQETQQDLQNLGFCKSEGDLHREVLTIAIPLRQPIDGEIFIFTACISVFSEYKDALETEVGPRLIALVRNVEAALGTLH